MAENKGRIKLNTIMNKNNNGFIAKMKVSKFNISQCLTEKLINSNTLFLH